MNNYNSGVMDLWHALKMVWQEMPTSAVCGMFGWGESYDFDFDDVLCEDPMTMITKVKEYEQRKNPTKKQVIAALKCLGNPESDSWDYKKCLETGCPFASNEDGCAAPITQSLFKYFPELCDDGADKPVKARPIKKHELSLLKPGDKVWWTLCDCEQKPDCETITYINKNIIRYEPGHGFDVVDNYAKENGFILWYDEPTEEDIDGVDLKGLRDD